MDPIVLLTLFLSLVALSGAGALIYFFRAAAPASRQTGMRTLMPSTGGAPGKFSDEDDDLVDIDEVKRRTGASKARAGSEDISVKLFKAGLYSAADKKRFARTQLMLPFVVGPVMGFGLYAVSSNPVLSLCFLVVGTFIGYAYPVSWLERRARARMEDVLYYLPLVIEQVSIGVSSSLDIGPCISHILAMADERDSHNPITEMFIHVEKLMRSGLNLEDSLNEVAEANGQTELKHAFMFLGQCAKHGGEISKQLQELADAVMVQRQVQVEARIAALPVKATGPLAVVFAGFFALLFAGLMVRLVEAFSGT